jgi:hypothetical protein
MMGLAALLVGARAQADPTKCQQGIEKNGTKLEASILKAFGKCTDGYRKAVDPTGVATAATNCQKALSTAVDFGNAISALAKTKAALDKLAGVTCLDNDLGALGHLRSDLFGDRWERLILLASLKNAYETQAALVGDFPAVMVKLAKTANCALCDSLSTPPCLTAACTLDTSSPNVETKAASPTPVPLPVTLSGVTITAGCEWQNVLPGEIGFLGSANIGLKPTSILGKTICNINFRAEGIYSCATSTAERIDYSTCQDSDTLNAGDSCTAGATQCQPVPDDLDTAHPAGGACVTFTPSGSPGGEGTAFVITTTRLRVSNAPGPDGVSCTLDDDYTATDPGIIPVTTGQAQASVVDWDNNAGQTVMEGPVTGTVGPTCDTVRSGVSTGLKLAGAFPAADVSNMPFTGLPGSPLGDTVTKLTLTCK